MKLKPETSRKFISIFSVVAILLTIVLTIWALKTGIFTDKKKMIALLGHHEVVKVLVFIFLQIFQVVVPIIPGGITLGVGVLVFGPFWGFVYNYLSICLGSLINFYLARRFGKRFIQYVAKPETYEKYENMANKNNRFLWFFAAMIAAPFAPDDILCLVAGLTEMTYRQFIIVILICKIPSIISYSFVLVFGGDFLGKILRSWHH
ncbi:TVP38/TMEM64 family protein [Xylocopilactobacillus apicola]|uniref:TVP38/TMEM64 family membrane protein n=1 Tax=Xylocopilactobacillus apicola TaxID=2932184 RepID=A0AAU9D2B5_9LACO|nr:TVP38/TMEM64 family protein [Xylocopilactobacillus apicola]BDR57879.1 TVP38/TMEM64 family protein [Xylocopilactobacillus apicola]